MPYAFNGDILNYVQANGPMDEYIASQVIYSVLSALKYLNGLGIIHRNINPENILIMNITKQKINILLSGFGKAAFYRQGEKFNDFDFKTFIYL